MERRRPIRSEPNRPGFDPRRAFELEWDRIPLPTGVFSFSFFPFSRGVAGVVQPLFLKRGNEEMTEPAPRDPWRNEPHISCHPRPSHQTLLALLNFSLLHKGKGRSWGPYKNIHSLAHVTTEGVAVQIWSNDGEGRRTKGHDIPAHYSPSQWKGTSLRTARSSSSPCIKVSFY